MGVIFAFFRDMTFFANISPRKNKTHQILLRKKVKYCENYPHVKGLANIFAKFSPNKNNQVCSNMRETVCMLVTPLQTKFERKYIGFIFNFSRSDSLSVL